MSNVNTQIKTGSYAVTTVYSMPWNKKKKTNTKLSQKKRDKKIIHEIFERCAEMTNDQYWVSIFKACARDKFPRGFQFKNGLLIHRRGNKTTRVMIPETTVEALSQCISFFKNASGIMSSSDRKRIQKQQEGRILEELNSLDIKWKDIKADRVKELLISEYISDLARINGFDSEQKKELITTVKKGFMLKYFQSKHITMENGKISYIKGLIYNKESKEFHIDPQLKLKNPGRKIKGLGIERVPNKPRGTPMELWEKYLINLEKKIKGKRARNFQVIDSTSSGSNSYSSDYSSPMDMTDSFSPIGTDSL